MFHYSQGPRPILHASSLIGFSTAGRAGLPLSTCLMNGHRLLLPGKIPPVVLNGAWCEDDYYRVTPETV